MSEVSQLTVRLANAIVGSQELDRAINEALGVDNAFHAHEGYTTSLDAAARLCERILPGWGWEVNRLSATDSWYPARVWQVRWGGGPEFGAAKATPALALLLALFRALNASEIDATPRYASADAAPKNRGPENG